MSPPRIPLAHLPTPIEELARLREALGGGPRILVKRDDQTGLAFGGNKTRKLEFLIAEAQAQGARTIISAGAVQSNHCRQTAAAAARFGFDCILVLNGEATEKPSGNLLLDGLLGAQIRLVPERSLRDQTLRETFEECAAAGKKPYLVPYGGSSATGALAYAYAVQEILDQNTRPDWILFATSSGGTQAGLVLGQRVFQYSGRILGISVDESEDWLTNRVSELASEASERLGNPIKFTPADIQVDAGYCEAGYGVLTEREREAIQLFARHEGLLLDPVYTGRAAAGLIDLVRRDFFKDSETVLFLHTGGQPALFADKYAEPLGSKPA
jgi:D-cysteine desulfhydrase